MEEGGCTLFRYQEVKICPIKGALAIFPTGWSYDHKGDVVKIGEKYIVTTFISLEDNRDESAPA